MSETAPANKVAESNGTVEQPAYNGETEEHTSKYINSICAPPIYAQRQLTKLLFVSLDKSPVSLEDKAPDSACDNSAQKTTTGNSNNNTTTRAKKRKKTPRDATAPKQPLTGYFR